MENQTKHQAIEMVEKSFPTIFAKEDVLTLLRSISEEGVVTDELRDELKEELKEELREEIREEIKDEFRDELGRVDLDDFVDKDTAEFSLDGDRIVLESVTVDSTAAINEILNSI